MTPIERYAAITRELAEERQRIGREPGGRPTMSLRLAELVEERARVAVQIADAALLGELNTRTRG